MGRYVYGKQSFIEYNKLESKKQQPLESEN